MKYYYISIWYNSTKKLYFFKKVRHCNYKVGYINSYGHKLILVIDLFDLFHPRPLKKRVARKLINFLEKIE